MANTRFRDPKSVEEDVLWLQETTPKNTRFNTIWAMKMLEEQHFSGGDKRLISAKVKCKQDNLIRINERTEACV